MEVRDLEYRYGARRALAGIDFAVASKQIFGLLGPNGGGKTTLFHVLSTLEKPDSGSVRVFGTDLIREPGKARPEIGVVFQRPSLDLHLKVEENLVHQGRLYGLRGSALKARIDRLLDRFRLTDRRRDLAGTLSGGLQRRVEIAKALLHGPRLLILDEPSSGLDPGARRDLWRVLEDLRDESQTTVLLTTHFIEEADRCDRLGLIDAGRLIAIDEPDALKSEIGGDVVVVRVEDSDPVAEELRRELGVDCIA
ncbi:MAG: ABC transporter ATP-binding protein, partial [Acidobacteriota bacterium]